MSGGRAAAERRLLTSWSAFSTHHARSAKYCLRASSRTLSFKYRRRLRARIRYRQRNDQHLRRRGTPSSFGIVDELGQLQARRGGNTPPSRDREREPPDLAYLKARRAKARIRCGSTGISLAAQAATHAPLPREGRRDRGREPTALEVLVGTTWWALVLSQHRSVAMLQERIRWNYVSVGAGLHSMMSHAEKLFVDNSSTSAASQCLRVGVSLTASFVS